MRVHITVPIYIDGDQGLPKEVWATFKMMHQCQRWLTFNLPPMLITGPMQYANWFIQ